MSAWLAVVSHEHVRRGVELGIVQVNHGKRAPLAHMRPGDTLVYYSPRELIKDGAIVKSFTAIGTIADGEIWQEIGGMTAAGQQVPITTADGGFHPFRRRVDYARDARVVPVGDIPLELTSSPNWGYALRRGLLPLSDADAAAIRAAMLDS